jgi:hypothetical protein
VDLKKLELSDTALGVLSMKGNMKIGDWVVFKVYRRQRDDTAKFGYTLVHDGWTYPVKVTTIRDNIRGDAKIIDGIMTGYPDDVKSKQERDCRLATADDFKGHAEEVVRQSQELTEAYYQEKERLDSMYSTLKKEIGNA